MKIILDKRIVHDLKNWFDSYVKTFNDESSEFQKNIDIKREHTQRVTEEIISIGKQIGLNENELNLAEVIALFHDIGRFQQYKRYNTYSDFKSENHANLGIKILKQNNVLGMLDKDLQKLILCSIQNHNRSSLIREETKACLFYSRLIRDADKLDIWRVVTDYYHRGSGQRNPVLELELPDTPGISEEVYKTLINKHIVDMTHVKNLNDMKLLQAGWIYDINFQPTFDYIKNRKYMELLKDSLPGSAEITNIFNLIYSFMMDR